MKKDEQKQSTVMFQNREIRKIWDDNQEKWYFSVVDVVGALSQSPIPKRYWADLKSKLSEEGSQAYDNIVRLKILAEDRKMRETDMADTETIFRIIQSIPSPNAEPFKLWLARVGYERVEETEDPEKAIQRAMTTYLQKGYTKSWIDLRLKSIEVRKGLTNEWTERGVKAQNEFAILTDDITFAWAGLKVKDYKKVKELKKENLRDNMTNLELVLNMLAEVSTTEISKVKEPKTFTENRSVAKQGGKIAGDTRKNIEAVTGQPVISKDNYLTNKKIKELK